MSALDREAVAAVDSTGQAAEILDVASHLRDARVARGLRQRRARTTRPAA